MPPDERDVREVRDAVEARAAALASGDADGLRRLMHEAARWTTFAGLVLDRDDYIARNTTRVRFTGQRLEDAVIRVVGDCAVVTGVVVDTTASGPTTKQFRLRITMTWVRDASGWRLLAGHAGPPLGEARLSAEP